LYTAFLPFEPVGVSNQEQPVIYHVNERFKRVALTFDDCFLITMLHRLEAILDENPDVRITLFPVGEALLNNQIKDAGIWKRFYEKGHEIGYHSFDHTNPELILPEDMVADYDRWFDALIDVLETTPQVHFARPPYGNVSRSFQYMCSKRGLVPTMWSTGWGGPTDNILRYTVPKIQPGDIVLLHTRSEDIDTTAKALPELKMRGYQPVTVSRLYMDWLAEQNESPGCYADPASLIRTCIE